MRAYEFIFEADKRMMGIYNPALDRNKSRLGDSNKPRISLKLLNRIKRQRKIHKKSHDKKLAVLPIIFGDPDQHLRPPEQ